MYRADVINGCVYRYFLKGLSVVCMSGFVCESVCVCVSVLSVCVSVCAVKYVHVVEASEIKFV